MLLLGQDNLQASCILLTTEGESFKNSQVSLTTPFDSYPSNIAMFEHEENLNDLVSDLDGPCSKPPAMTVPTKEVIRY